MSRRSFFLLYIIFLFLGGCNQIKESTANLDAGAKLVYDQKPVRFQIDHQTYNISDFLMYVEDSSTQAGEILASLNQNLNEIILFDIGDRSMRQRVKFAKDGPKGVGSLKGFYMTDPDSILLFSHNSPKIRLAETDGSIRKEWEFDYPDAYADPIINSNYFSSLPFQHRRHLITKTLRQGNYHTFEAEDLHSFPLLYMHDLESGSVSLGSYTIPEEIWRDEKTHYEFSLTGNTETIAVSFFADHHIFYKKSDLEGKKMAKSSFLPMQFDPIPLGGSREERLLYFATTPHYGSLIYDRFRDVYYRFAFPRVEEYTVETLRQIARFPEVFSIMILDHDFEKIGETKFENQKLLTSNVFVGREGLYISVNHPDNPANREDYLSFVCLKLDEL